MRPRSLFPFLFCFFLATNARADDSSSVVLHTGAAMFLGGYVPVFAAALPSAAGLAGRILVHTMTAGLLYLAQCASLYGDEDPDDPNPRHPIHDSYLCNGEHGAIQLLLPVAGPFLFAANHPHDDIIHASGDELSGGTRALLYTSGGLQIVGAVLMLVGLATRHQEGPKPVADATPPSTKPQLHILPSLSSQSIGVMSLVTF